MRRPRRDIRTQGGAAARLDEVVIERMGAQGEGVAAGPVYAPFTLPGEQVRLRIQGDRGEVQEIMGASPDRVEPPQAVKWGQGGSTRSGLAPMISWTSPRSPWIRRRTCSPGRVKGA